MTSAPSARTFTLAALIVTVILAGAYGFNRAGQGNARTGTRRFGAAAGTPAASAVAPPTSGEAAARAPAAPDRPPLPAELNGPFGSRRTTGDRSVALTFDDGPDPRYTPQVLALLRRWRVAATFCLVGVNVRAYPQLVRAIAADGHTLCNHSWQHDVGLGSRPRTEIRANLMRTSAAIRAAVPGARISYYRQPAGRWTAEIVAVARELGMTTLHWAIDSVDWSRPGSAAIEARVDRGTCAGAIVLMHDAGGDRSGTVSALRSILPNLSRRFRLAALPVSTSGAPAPHPTPT